VRATVSKVTGSPVAARRRSAPMARWRVAWLRRRDQGAAARSLGGVRRAQAEAAQVSDVAVELRFPAATGLSVLQPRPRVPQEAKLALTSERLIWGSSRAHRWIGQSSREVTPLAAMRRSSGATIWGGGWPGGRRGGTAARTAAPA
jgi:hypothetical protein